MKTQTYTKEQLELINELSTEYGLDPLQISFFDSDPEPFFDRDATAVLIHKLTDAVGIEDDLANAPTLETLAVKYKITFEDGSFASSTGMANLAETIDGTPMTVDQVKSLATSRAARGALRNRGISLIRLHTHKKHGGQDSNVASVEFSGPPRGQYESLLREAHALGQETGYILRTGRTTNDGQQVADKSAWYRILAARYSVEGANQLQLAELQDLVAFLRSQLPARAAA